MTPETELASLPNDPLPTAVQPLLNFLAVLKIPAATLPPLFAMSG